MTKRWTKGRWGWQQRGTVERAECFGCGREGRVVDTMDGEINVDGEPHPVRRTGWLLLVPDAAGSGSPLCQDCADEREASRQS